MDDLTKAIMADEANLSYTERGIFPLYDAPQTARIIIVGQAPGIVAQETKLYWNDRSGIRLRDWLGVDNDTFTTQDCLALSLWISIILVRENPVTYHLEGLRLSGTRH